MTPQNEPESPASPEPDESWWTLERAAFFCGVSRDAIKRLGQRGAVEIVKFSPRHTRVNAASVRAYIARLRAEQKVG